jgi:hypothetical protein
VLFASCGGHRESASSSPAWVVPRIRSGLLASHSQPNSSARLCRMLWTRLRRRAAVNACGGSAPKARSPTRAKPAHGIGEARSRNRRSPLTESRRRRAHGPARAEGATDSQTTSSFRRSFSWSFMHMGTPGASFRPWPGMPAPQTPAPAAWRRSSAGMLLRKLAMTQPSAVSLPNRRASSTSVEIGFDSNPKREHECYLQALVGRRRLVLVGGRIRSFLVKAAAQHRHELGSSA